MKSNLIVPALILFLAISGALLIVHANNGNTLPTVEVNALFEYADKNGDGTVSKDEFQTYLESRKISPAVLAQVQSDVRICPNSGQPCTGDCSGEDGMMMSATDGCCSGMSGSTAAAPFAASGAKKTAFERSTTGGCGGMAGGGCCKEK